MAIVPISKELVDRLVEGKPISEYELSLIDKKELFLEYQKRKPKFSGRIRVPEPVTGMVPNFTNWSHIVKHVSPILTDYATAPGSSVDSLIVLPKQIRGLSAWISEQRAYASADARRMYVMRGYTFKGDSYANNFLRRTLDMKRVTFDEVNIPYAYQIYDNYEWLVSKRLTMPPKDTLLEADGSPNQTVIRALLEENKVLVKQPRIFGVLIQGFCKELKKIIYDAPRFSEDVYVYRGIHNEDHLIPRTLEYVNRSFQSTTLNPYVAVRAFTKPFLGTPYKCCLYEVRIPAGTPVLYMETVTKIEKEFEVLLPYNMRYVQMPDLTLKYTPPSVSTSQAILDDVVDRETVRDVDLIRIFVRGILVTGFSADTDPVLYSTTSRAVTRKSKKSDYIRVDYRTKSRKRTKKIYRRLSDERLE